MLDRAIIHINRILFLLLFLFISSFTIAEDITYIDPSHNNSRENGTLEYPYKSFDDVVWKRNHTYLIKKGTTLKTDKISIRKNKITIGAYGDGELPKIVARKNVNHVFYIRNKKRITIENLEIIGNNSTSCLFFNGNRNSLISINNCVLSNAFNGLRIIGKAYKFRVLDCTISDIFNDGIYAKNIRQIEIGRCTIRNVNLAWNENKDQKISSGDCVQIDCTNSVKYNIYSNLFDHSSTGNKFCLIIHGKNAIGEINKNQFIGNITGETSCLYIGHESKNVSITNNIFQFGSYGIYNYCSNTVVEYNIFKENKIALAAMQNTRLSIYNNLFHDNGFQIDAFEEAEINLYNNIFLIKAGKEYAFEFRSENIDKDNNLYNLQPKYFSLGDHSIIGEPEFKKDSYFLKPNSPCINHGRNIGKSTDYFGNTIQPKDQKDIGIHEFVSP
jgi:hypothetical protein